MSESNHVSQFRIAIFGRIIHDGARSIFADPSWRPMQTDDWASIGMNPNDFVP
jgi:hypothetical protein